MTKDTIINSNAAFAEGELLLTTTDVASGEERTSPLIYIRDGDDRLLVVASSAKEAVPPAWYENLLAHPMVRVETGTDDYWAVAIPAEDAERDRLFKRFVAEQPGYAEYQATGAHPLPVVILERPYTEADPGEVTNLADKLLEIHGWLRGQLRLVHAEVAAYLAGRGAHTGQGEPSPPGLSLQIRQHCLAFCESLRFHHTSEDDHTFPELERRHPHLSEPLRQLRAGHQTVARIHDELVALLADITTADQDRFQAELKRMSSELEAHLSYEEKHLIPVLREIPLPPPPQ